MKSSYRIGIVLFLHLFLFNGLYVFRPAQPVHPSKWYQQIRGGLKGDFAEKIQLLYSLTADEAYYYSWSTKVLGKNLKKGDPYGAAESSAQKPSMLLPYRDIPFEYPPLLILPLLAARLLSTDYLSFTRSFAFILSLFYLASLFFLHRIWQKIPDSCRICWAKLLALSCLALLLIGQISVARLDLIPSFFSILALSCFLDRKYAGAALALSLGALSKSYPLVLAPLFALVLIREKKWRDLAESAAITIGILFFAHWGLSILTEGRIWESYQFHAKRGIHFESVNGTWVMLGHFLFNTPIQTNGEFNSFNISSSLTPFLLKLGYPLALFVFGLIYFLFWRSLKRDNAFVVPFLQSAFLLVGGFILTFKVFSPQFLLWLIPLFLVVNVPRRGLWILFFLLMLFLTQLVYPYFYTSLLNRSYWSLLFLRNLILLGLWIYVLVCLIRWKKPDPLQNS